MTLTAALRLRGLRDDPGIEGRSDHVEFLIAWSPRPAQTPVALHLLSVGAAEWVDGWAFGGIALGTDIASFAVSTMRNGAGLIGVAEMRRLHDAVDLWERRSAELLRGDG
jgi:hypothetical protein